MNKIIYKYPLSYSEINYIAVPIGAQILTVQTQGDSVPYIWAVAVDQENLELTRRKIALRFTGEMFESDNTEVYIGTFTSNRHVFHAFDLGEDQ
jgi:hypothetical protein